MLQILFSTLSFKSIRKCDEVLRHIVTGLVDNKFIKTEFLLEFAYGTMSDSIPDLSPNYKREVNKKEEIKKPDSYLIPEGDLCVIQYYQMEMLIIVDCSDFRTKTYFRAVGCDGMCPH